MKGLYILLSCALFALQAHAQSSTLKEESADLEALYEELDEAISMSSRYVADRERHIAACRDSLRKADSPEKQLQMTEQLYQLYRYYKNASALHYIEQCVELSDSIRRPDLAGRYRSMLASQCSNTDMEAELHLKMDILCAQRHFQDALLINNKWLKSVKNGTHESAFAGFYRSQVFQHLNNHKMTCYWLGRSALDDIRSGIMDQASLLFLAEQLANDGDLDRATRYMEFSKACNDAFIPNMRAYQFNSILTVIEKGKAAAEQRLIQLLIAAGVVIALLLIALVVMFLRRKA